MAQTITPKTPAPPPPPKSTPQPQPSSPKTKKPAQTPPVTEVKKSPFRFLIPIVIGIIILAVLGFAGTKLLNLGGTSQLDTVEITYWGLWEPSQVLDEVFVQFEQQNPGVTINYQQQSSQDYRERLQNSLESGDGPDIFRFHQTWTPMLGSNMSTVPKDIYSSSDFQSTFYPSAYTSLNTSKGIVGIPLMFEGLGLFYNQDIFEAAGKTPPESWEDLRRLAKQLTIPQGEQIQRGGIALGTINNVEHWPDILGAMLYQNGADPAKPNNKNGQDALTFYTLFSTLDRVWDESMPPSTFAFATSKAVMMIAPSWRAHDVVAQNPDLRFAIAPIPQLPDQNITWASFWAEGVSKSSSKAEQELSWKLLYFLSQKEQLRQFYASASTVRLFGEPFSRVDMADQLVSDPYVGSFVAGAPQAKSWFLSSWTHDNGINDGIIKYYEDAVNSVLGGSSASKALTTTEQGIDQVLSRYNLK